MRFTGPAFALKGRAIGIIIAAVLAAPQSGSSEPPLKSAAEQTKRRQAQNPKSISKLVRHDAEFTLKAGALIRPIDQSPDVLFGTEKLEGTMNEIRHTGLTFRADRGTVVRAAAPGLVVFAEMFEWSGLTIVIDHGSDIHTVYSHLNTTAVPAGRRVDAAEAIGTVGDSGSFDGSKLYFEVRKNGLPLDPEQYF